MSQSHPQSSGSGKALSGLFGPLPVLGDENRAAYRKLLAHVSECLKPNDILEEIWLRDAVDLSWEALRWRRLIKELLDARSLPACIDHVERLNRLALAAEARRNAALREIDRHRSLFAQSLRRVIHDVEKSEYQVIEATNSNSAARKDVA